MISLEGRRDSKNWRVIRIVGGERVEYMSLVDGVEIVFVDRQEEGYVFYSDASASNYLLMAIQNKKLIVEEGCVYDICMIY